MVTESQRTPPELLAPAGGPESLIAAVRNGADAVYCGLGAFNARRGADNFDETSLAEATAFAHLRGARVYLTANIVVLEHEMADALHTVEAAWQAGVDAVIVQDLGLMRAIRAAMPDVRIHASTQLNTHNTPTVETLASLGAARVTLARETSIPEIATLVSTGVEIESFVHGSLCYSYSGQCLMSSIIGARSANRGLCAQPCRMPYALVGSDGIEAPVPGKYLLSPQDLAGIELLPQLIATGVASLKIEGRMKSPEYVALVTGVYRAALDRAFRNPEGFQVLPAEWETLTEAFSRGFTEGNLTRQFGDTFMSWKRPNNRGVPVGRVARAESGRAIINLDRSLAAEDTIEFWTGRGRFAQRVGPMDVEAGRTDAPAGVAGRGQLRAPAGVHAMIKTDRGVGPGDRVFRVANADLLAAARHSITGPERRPITVDVAVTVRGGEPLAVELRSGDAMGRAEGAVVETARTKALTADEVVEHVGRFGGTPYRAASWSVDLELGVGLSFSALHDVRRRAVDALEAAVLAPWGERAAARADMSALEETLPARRGTGSRHAAPVRPEIVVVAAADAAAACRAAGADRVLVAVLPSDPLAVLPVDTQPLIGRIVHDGEVNGAVSWAVPGMPMTVGNLGVMVASASVGATVHADWPLNLVNPWSVSTVADLGATMAWASPELSSRQLADLVASSPIPVGVLAFGRLELMVGEVCTLQALGPCARECAACTRRSKQWVLRDQKRYEFPVWTDASGRSHVMNSVVLDLSRSLDELLGMGVAALRVDVADLPAAEAADVVRAFVSRVEAAAIGAPEAERPIAEPATTGHFFRGVR